VIEAAMSFSANVFLSVLLSVKYPEGFTLQKIQLQQTVLAFEGL
jgi:hypothetical protein